MARADNIFAYYGTAGDDIIYANNRGNYVEGYAGDDVIYLLDGDDTAFGGEGNDQIWGGNGNDLLKGVSGNDSLYGEAGNDELWGQKGEDVLVGGDGADILWGGADKDFLYGGTGADRFEYRSVWESTTNRYDGTSPEFSDVTGGIGDIDEIFGFESGIDKLWLTKLDADVSTPIVYTRKGSTGNEDFRFVEKTDGFVAGDLTLTYAYDANGNVTSTTLNAHIDNDGIADLTILIHGYVDPALDLWL